MLFQGRNLISSGQLSSGSLLAFVFYQKDMVTNMKVRLPGISFSNVTLHSDETKCWPSFCSQHLVYIFGDMLNTVGSAIKVFQLLDRKPLLREAGDLAPEKLKGRLRFENVSFTYHTRPDLKALKVSFCLYHKSQT